MNSKMLNAYYLFKPFIMRRIQIYMRRFLAERKQKAVGHLWPIDESAGKMPDNWPGWPDGKKFALVLTHDVERQDGVEKCLKLMEIDKNHGFRSSFNFVPHDYNVPRDLRKRLTDEGFEIGVHGLNHEGNMFSSRETFERQSVQINKILKEWGSAGFRAPSMYHNLEWIRDLDIEYDSSTFDTDPFEPQPDGVGTIFPFSMNGTYSQPGYIELPYTLPQDFLLFIILRHKDIEVWKKKLDWIVEKGGMANFIVHPDYINFGDSTGSFDKYPVRYYTDFLEYIKYRYEGQYWQSLPRDLSRYCNSFIRNDKKNDSPII
jgi:peptidoglycan/xylan/chitin deacetylase (PgdA/CDA1 family)